MTRRSLLPAIGLFLVAGFVGLKMAQKSWDGVSYFNASNIAYDRDPAAIRPVADLSHLEGQALQFASQNRLLDGAEILQGQDGVSVSLGNFVVKGEDGKKRLACQAYDTVMIELFAEGFAVNGEQTRMLLEGDCRISASDINQIAAFTVPFKDLMHEEAKDAEFSFYGKRPLRVRVESLFDQWPKSWAVQRVTLKNSLTHKEVSVSAKDLTRAQAENLRFSVK